MSDVHPSYKDLLDRIRALEAAVAAERNRAKQLSAQRDRARSKAAAANERIGEIWPQLQDALNDRRHMWLLWDSTARERAEYMRMYEAMRKRWLEVRDKLDALEAKR